MALFSKASHNKTTIFVAGCFTLKGACTQLLIEYNSISNYVSAFHGSFLTISMRVVPSMQAVLKQKCFPLFAESDDQLIFEETECLYPMTCWKRLIFLKRKLGECPGLFNQELVCPAENL